MTEKRFLAFTLTEGIVLTVLGLCMLMLPKVTSVTFGMMICLAFIIYGIYKIVNACLTKNYSRHFILNIILGALLAIVGTVLLVMPMMNLLVLTSIIGVYFLIESISTTAFAVQTRKTLYLWWVNLIVAFMQFFIGFIIIIGLPSTALWVIGMLAGINFLIAGMTLISMFISNKYIYNA